MSRWLTRSDWAATKVFAWLTAWGLFAVGAAPNINDASASRRVALFVGANQGSANEPVLRYAVRDAVRVRDAFIAVGGIRPTDAAFVHGTSTEVVLEAIKEIAGKVALETRPTALLFYYAGHGDARSLHLGDSTLDMDRLRAALSGVAADVHISIIDACRTSSLSRGLEESEMSVQERSDPLTGTVEMFAASSGQASQESDALLGAVFTHELVAGLRGGADADQDQRVTLGELYSWVYRRTLLRSSLGSSVQQPSLQMKWTGAGEFTMSWLDTAVATLILAEKDARYSVFAQPSGAFIAEVMGHKSATLAVAKGRYLVLRKNAWGAMAAQVDLSAGGSADPSSDFRPLPSSPNTRRGELPIVRPWALGAGLGVRVEEAAGERFIPSFVLELSYRFTNWRPILRVGVGAIAGAPLQPSGWNLSVGPAVQWFWVQGPIAVSFVGATEVFFQRSSELIAALQLRAGLRFSVAIGAHFDGWIELGGGAALQPRSASKDFSAQGFFFPSAGVERSF